MAEIALRNGGVTLVDDEDVLSLSAYRWAGYTMRSRRRYVVSDQGGARIYLHRLLMGEPPDLEVDHINGNPLDNRRENLRVVTHQINQQNRRCGYGRTGERNVYLTKMGHYEVKLQPKSGTLRIGVFRSFEEAVEAARLARLRYFPGAVS